MEVIDALITIAPRDAYKRTSDGSRRYASVYRQAVAAGLLPARTLDDAATLHAIFDLAVDHGFGSWVLDYVEEVCSDEYCTSNDPVEAYLVDGDCVLTWCSQRLASTWKGVKQALSSAGQLGLDVQRCASVAHALELALEALHRPVAGRTLAAGSRSAQKRAACEGDMRKVQLLKQCLQVLDWSLAQGVDSSNPSGRHASMAAWSGALQARRAARPSTSSGATFLDTMLQQLGLARAYPFANYKEALLELFGSGQASQLSDKLALYLHYMLDASHVGPRGVGALQRALGLPPQQVAMWQCQQLLDEAQPGNAQDPLLQRACSLLAQHAGPSTPFRFVEALAAHGRPEAALAVFRASARAGEAGLSLKQATSLLDVRLRCGLLAEALAGISSYCSGTSGPQGEEHCKHCDHASAYSPSTHCPAAQRLAEQLASWAANASEEGSPWLQQLLALPLDSLQEDALLGWLKQRQAAGDHLALALPLYFAQRGRLAEALWYYATWQDSRQAPGAAPPSAAQQAQEQLLAELMAACAAQLPAGLQSAAVQRHHGPPALLVGGLPVPRDSEVPPAVLPYRGASLPPFVASRWAPDDSAEMLTQAGQAPAAPAEPFATPASMFSMLGSAGGAGVGYSQWGSGLTAGPTPGTTTRHLLFAETPGSAMMTGARPTPSFFTPREMFSGFKAPAEDGAGTGLGAAGTPSLFGGLPRMELEGAGGTPGGAPRSIKRLRATPLMRPR